VQTLYVRWGDWFVAVSAVLAALAWATLRKSYQAPAVSKHTSLRGTTEI
jgi:hypothetical protein